MNELVLRESDHALVVNSGLPQRATTMPFLRHAVGVAQSRWRLAFVVAALTLGLVIVAAIMLPKSEYAEARLVINPVATNPTQPAAQGSSLPPDTSAIDTEVEILRSPAIALAVAQKLQLYKDPEFGGAQDMKSTDPSLRNVVAAVQGHSRIRRIGLTYVVQVGFVASTMARAKQIADGLVNAYIARKLDEKLSTILRANHELGSTLGTLRNQAVEAEARVQDYQARNKLAGTNGMALMQSEMSTLDQQIAGAQADSAEKNARLSAALRQENDGTGASDVGATLASGTVGALRQKEADLSATLSQLQTEFQADYPAVQKTTAQLAAIRQQLKSETGRILSGLRSDAGAAAQREQSLLASRQQTADQLAANNRALAGLLTLQQDADTAKKIYETYLTRASDVSAARSLQQVDATVESRAIATPGSPFRSLSFILIIGAVLAAIAALVAVLLKEGWNRRIRSWVDVTRETGFQLAAVLPDVAAVARANDPSGHIMRHPLTASAESIRSLRAFLAVSSPKSKVIAVTSSVPGEGKTFTSVCLARSLAASGQKVVLLDCDLRRASASKYFDKPEYGITEIMGKQVPVERALTQDVKSGLWFLSGTATSDISGDIVGTERVDELLRKLSTQFDKVIIDTSPLLGFGDARIYASCADCVLHVVRWDHTPASTVHAAMQILRQSEARVAGIVLNKVNVRQQARYGFADGSDYFHYYGSAYAQRA